MFGFTNSLNRIFKERLKIDESLKNKCTFKIGGITRFYVEIESVKELKFVLKKCKKYKIRYFILGAGSNVLFPDYFDGIIICTKRMNKVELQNFNRVKVDSGTMLQNLCNICKLNNLSGLEWAVGIPGTVGGALRMNAGAFDNQICNYLESVTILRNGKIENINAKNLSFEYRKGVFFDDKGCFIINAVFHFKTKMKNIIERNMNLYLVKRQKTQNVMFPSAGSVFKRKKNITASEMIDKAGLKGTAFGGAMVSKVHSGYIVNTGNAKTEDVINLINFIKTKVFENFKENLDLEIIIVN